VNSQTVEQLLDSLLAQGEISMLDREVARLWIRLAPGDPPVLGVVAAMVRNGIDQGHVCLPLTELAGQEIGEGSRLPDSEDLLAMLKASPLVGDNSRPGLLALDQGRLYLYRYWEYETRLARMVLERARWRRTLGAATSETFSSACKDLDPGQKRAVELASTRRLAVITGGPGTGKTTLVGALLRFYAALHGTSHLFRGLLLAPTGKAAARLGEQLGRSGGEIAGKVLAMTIHRALEPDRGTNRFRRSHRNPLDADLVVVDEASMVDLSLMTRLLDAVAPESVLVLIGDKDQLASVEAGGVLNDICEAGRSSRILNDVAVELTTNFRFGDAPGITTASRLIRDGDADGLLGLLLTGEYPDVRLDSLNNAAWRRLEQKVGAWFGRVVASPNPEEALARLNRFRILAPHRGGSLGVEGLNRFAARLLHRGGVTRSEGEWFKGRPVLVTANSYHLGLMNGDVGVAWPDPETPGRLKVFFERQDGRVKGFLPSALPPYEPAFAMTVHKSQGSEFGEVVLVLPEETTQLMGRELLYTAVTRARKRLWILGSGEVVRQTAQRRLGRHSGLKERLCLEAAPEESVDH